jgi:serine phosphatase RsbU (regulator of sigma subunit)
VAGDFYDFVDRDGGLGVVVADVAGHGVPAALIASMVKIAFASQADHADDPARILTEMNHALCGRMRREFVTAAYVWIDPSGGAVLVAGAGHPHPLLLRPGHGAPREVGHNGVLLGRFADAEYGAQRVEVAAGDRLVLFTDAVYETRSADGEPFGEERLHAFLAEHAALDADALLDALLRRVSSWAGDGGLEDDLTVVVVDLG